ncbi:unnamed protein product [Nippostrongylus brasiliensis]|uniref:Ovule protein n=1 Tax=Nippostrongylus brasiliensis TaxID=27835 RepID=A0A0N4XDQ0_NIPBR|nr:unnamed protein product [Nippostrongylus brasiliensis]
MGISHPAAFEWCSKIVGIGSIYRGSETCRELSVSSSISIPHYNRSLHQNLLVINTAANVSLYTTEILDCLLSVHLELSDPATLSAKPMVFI